MFFDLQFSQAKFLELLQDQIQRALPLITDEFDNPIGSGKLLVDHLECNSVTIDDMPSKTITINGPNGPTTINGNVVKMKIDVDVMLTTREKAIAAGHFGIPELQKFGLWVKAEISAKAATNGDIKLSVQPIELGAVLDVLTPKQKADLLAKMPSVDQTIALPEVAGHPMKATNAGLTLHNNVVAVRAELSAPDANTKSAWTSFYAGNLPVLGGEWAIQLPPELLVEVTDDALTEAIDSLPTKDPSLEVISEPSTSWGVTGPISHATLNAVDACPVGASDIEFDLNFAVGFSLHQGNIRVTITVTWDLNDWDVFRCAAATVLLPGAIITAIAGIVLGPVGAIVAAVLSIIGFIIAIVAISDKAHGNLSSHVGDIDPGDMNLQTVEKDNSHAVIQGEIALGTLLPGMTPTVVTGTPFGLLLAGTLAVPAHKERSLEKVAQTPFEWGGGYSCSKGMWAPEQWDAKISFGDPAHYPLSCSVEVLTNPPSTYVIAPTWPSSFGYTTVDAHSTVTDGTGPDCELLIHTNSGTRYANLGHLAKQPAPPSPEQLLQDKIACFKSKLPGPKKWLEAIWLVDPPPYERIAELNVWDLVASQLTTGTLVEAAIVDRAGRARTVATMQADRRGQAAFRMVTGPGEHVAVSAKSGSMRLWAAGAAAQQVARFIPHTSAVDAVMVGSGASARVALATRDHVLVLGLDGTSLGRALIPGVKHVVATGTRIAAHDGARVVSMNVSRAAPAPHAAPVPLSFVLAPTRSWIAGQEIIGLDARGGTITATMRDGGKVVLDRHLSPIAAPQRGERWLAEPWLAAPIRVGTLVARVEKGAVAVYRYRSTAVF